MTFTARTKDAAGDVTRAADQNESVDNDDHLFAAVYGPTPAATGGMVRQWVKLTGIADNVATEFCTITTANAAGDHDGGVWTAIFEGLVAHGYAEDSDDTSVIGAALIFSRALEMHGTPGGLSTVVSFTTPGVAASASAAKSITAPITFTTAETSEYITSVRVQADLIGTTVTTAAVFGMVRLFYAGFLTPPVITSIG